MIKLRVLYRILCLIGFSASLQAAPLQKLPVLDRMVASVNGEAITESELARQTNILMVRLQQSDTPLPPLTQLRQQLLEKMITEKCQLQLAAKAGIEIDDTTLNNAISEIAERDNLSVSQMQKFLEEQQIPFSQFKQTIKTELTLSKIQYKEVGQLVNVSKADIDHFINSPAGVDHSGTEYRLGHILIPLSESPSTEEIQEAEKEANTLVKNLKAGANFSKTAVEKSAGQQAMNGGDLGWRKMAEIPSLFVKVPSTIAVGGIAGPLRDTSGFHIVKLLDKRMESINKSEKLETQARQKALDILFQRKYDEQLVSWLRRLRANADAEIYLNET